MGGVIGAALMIGPGNAFGASIAIAPKKSCYRSSLPPNDEQVFLGGNGFTPGAMADITLDRRHLGFTRPTNVFGQFAGTISFGLRRGEHKRLLAATDQANVANFATLSLRTSNVAVSIRPLHARPGQPVRVKAAGFTGSTRLYAHIRRGRYRRNIAVGRLRRACRELRRKRTIVPAGVRPGKYKVQFDAKRRYSKRTKPRVKYTFTVFRRRLGRTASAAAAWVRLP